MKQHWNLYGRTFSLLLIFLLIASFQSEAQCDVNNKGDNSIVNTTDIQKLIERATLIEIYQASPANTLGEEWAKLNMKASDDICDLPGVSCNLEGKIKTLNLMEKNLSVLPASLPNLTSLEILDLYGNQLTILPDAICNLQSLQELYLSNNQLTILPQGLNKLKNLSLYFVL